MSTRLKPKKGVVVGVDVSKRWLDLHCLPKGEKVRFEMHELSLAIAWMMARRPSLVVMEASGGYEADVWLALEEAGCAVAIVNPLQVRRFAEAAGQHAKNDRIDAELIARYGVTMKPRVTPRIANPRLRELLRRRSGVVEHLSAEKNRLKQAKDELVREMILASIRFCNQQRRDVDAALARELATSDVDQRRVDLLDSVAGIAQISARALVILLPELGKLCRRKMAKLVGVAPITRESGEWKGKRFIGQGRAAARAVLYMPTLVAVRHNPVMKAYYVHLLASGKAKKVALTACMRKLLTIINAIVKADSRWEDRSPAKAPPAQLPLAA